VAVHQHGRLEPAGEPAGRAERLAAAKPTVVAWWILGVLAASKVAFQLATANLYGAHRDEFYYLESGHHLAWGYVDNPPLVPLLYRLQEAAFGHSVAALAVVPSLLGGAFIIIGGLIAADLGGGRAAQTLTGLVAWLGPIFLTTSHFLSTVSLDLVFWALASWLLVRLVRGGDTRLWLIIGLVCGVGLLNKDTMIFWAIAAGIGLICTPQRALLRSGWLAAGGLVALAVVSPNVIWQAQHHWATLEFLRNLRSDNSSTDRVQFAPLQLAIVTLAGTLIWAVALRAVLRRPEWRAQRWLAYGYVAAFVILFVFGGKAYYLGSWYLPLVAVGAVVIERFWSRARRQVLTAAVVATGMLTAPLFTPIFPVRAAVAAGFDTTNSDLGAMLGWPHLVDQIASTVNSLPAGQRTSVVIFTEDYSEAGAVDFYGSALRLPAAISGHNSFWLWGYGHPAADATVIAVGLPATFVHSYWSTVHLAATLGTTGPVLDPQERGASIWICQHQRIPWEALWPSAKHYN
jgi:hypothetical protein